MIKMSQQQHQQSPVTLPQLIVRNSLGLFCYNTSAQPDTPLKEPLTFDQRSGNKTNDQLTDWSPDGKLLAWCNNESITVFNVNDNFSIWFQCSKRVVHLFFSPRGTYLITYEHQKIELNQKKNNITVYSMVEKKILTFFTDDDQQNWRPQFSDDESICLRLVPKPGNSATKDIWVYQNHNFEEPSMKVSIDGLKSAVLFPRPPYHVATYTCGKTLSQTSSARLLRFPDLKVTNAMAAKAFQPVDQAEILWNHSGTGALVHTQQNSSSGYYSDTILYYLTTSGAANYVDFKQVNERITIHDLKWNPAANEFCVVYGMMPARACIFNAKGESAFDFCTGVRNSCSWSPQGHILALFGQGSVKTRVEIWDRTTCKLITIIHDSVFGDMTHFEWSPCGERFILATLSPRMNVDNKFCVFNLHGNVIHQLAGGVSVNGKDFKLYEATFQKFPTSLFPPRKITFTPIRMQDLQVQEATKPKYVPPHLKKQMQQNERKNIQLDLNSLPENERNAISRKHVQNGSSNASVTFKSSAEMNSVPGAGPMTGGGGGSGLSAEAKKNKNRISNLNKKLREIDDLKTRQKQGEKLDKQKMEKIKSEKEIRKELEQLKLE